MTSLKQKMVIRREQRASQRQSSFVGPVMPRRGAGGGEGTVNSEENKGNSAKDLLFSEKKAYSKTDTKQKFCFLLQLVTIIFVNHYSLGETCLIFELFQDHTSPKQNLVTLLT